MPSQPRRASVFGLSLSSGELKSFLCSRHILIGFLQAFPPSKTMLEGALVLNLLNTCRCKWVCVNVGVHGVLCWTSSLHTGLLGKTTLTEIQWLLNEWMNESSLFFHHHPYSFYFSPQKLNIRTEFCLNILWDEGMAEFNVISCFSQASVGNSVFKDCFSMWLSKTLKVFFYEVDTFKASTPGKNKYTILTALKWVFAQRLNTYIQERKRKTRYNEYPCETYFSLIFYTTGTDVHTLLNKPRNLKESKATLITGSLKLDRNIPWCLVLENICSL